MEGGYYCCGTSQWPADSDCTTLLQVCCPQWCCSKSPRQRESSGRHARLYIEMQRTGSDSSSWDYTAKNSTQMPSMWKNTAYVKPFHWANHPALMADALERGWTAFALSSTSFPSSGASPKLWNTYTKAAHNKGSVPEITWEIGPATELMQLIRFNPGLSSTDAPVQILHSALPVPGPAFGARSFPQEAYFEIVILAEGSEHRASFSYDYAENDEVTLIPKPSPSLIHSTSGSEDIAGHCLDGFEGKGKLESGRLLRLKSFIENRGAPIVGGNQLGGSKPQLNLDAVKGNEAHVMAIGLTIEAPQPLSLPGTYWGSVGFHSDGQIFLNGYLHIEKSNQSKRIPWAAVSNTLGCGFNPRTNKVFFTLNGEHVGDLICSKGEFEQPLHVSIGSNYDATVMVNFGQGPFVYTPANSQRTPIPGSQPTPSRSIESGQGYDDSGDLFSMGTVDFSKILGESENATCQDLQHHHAFSEAESELFEIVLEGRSLQ
ncbi:hypothetical protein O6H91_05G004200 [Diphasiastrum complanatum]|uniref:Uncharacterized protein n=1 Tax=Diphasiastrum complanatum TaxID=34168 RepID=A0ACC2DK72_DIPCM|nr:hypothetical protein O6H91_05G004200 [Diphasiastrum complanatum]